MTKTTRIVCLCILGAVGMLCGIPAAYASLSRCSETLINHTNITHYNYDSNDHPIVNQAVGNGETPQWPIDDKPGLLLDKDKPIAPSQDLQITENITTLQEQEDCETAILANYAYLADGTKFKATNADGDGLVYTGSLRWRLKDGVLTPESVAITGGRAVCDTTDTWAANYYICDHLGSVRTVTDENGTVLANYDYLPYGTDMSRDAATADVTDYRFTGKEVQRDFGANLYDSFARFQHNNGRFLSIDPKAEAFYHISPYAYCAGDPVNLVDPDGEAWKPTKHSNLIDGTSYYTGFEWIDESESYDENGNLKQGLFNQAIFFSDNLTFDSSKVHNMGSSTAYVYLESGEVVTYDACTHPSSPDYPTIPEKLVEATYGKHNNDYEALRMHDFGNASSQIYLGFENPAHKGRDYIEGANIHKAGERNKTGMTRDRRPISAGCFLIDRNQWKSFISHFNSSSIVGVVASRNGVTTPINQNTCKYRIIPFTYELFD